MKYSRKTRMRTHQARWPPLHRKFLNAAFHASIATLVDSCRAEGMRVVRTWLFGFLYDRLNSSGEVQGNPLALIEVSRG
ncbi:hypothetical protein C8Q79DRAFT_994750, partial [Trametes meyenii]